MKARRSAAAPLDFSHLIPAPSRSTEGAAAVVDAPFAERVMRTVANVQGKAFDRSQMASAPAQGRTLATGADIVAAYRAAHPSRFEGA